MRMGLGRVGPFACGDCESSNSAPRAEREKEREGRRMELVGIFVGGGAMQCRM